MRKNRFRPLPFWLLLLALPAGGCAHLCTRWCETREVEEPLKSLPPKPHDERPATLPTPAPRDAPAPRLDPPSPVAAADSLFAQGELAAARASYRAYLENNPGGPQAAHALLRLAVIYLQPDGPAYDPGRAGRVIDRLLAEHPESPERPAALALRTLQRRAAELQQQLDELKRIDLDPDGDEEPPGFNR